MDRIMQSTIFKWLLAGFGALILLILVFAAGLAVGFHKAHFTERWNENYYSNFAGPGSRRALPPDLGGRDMMSGHGTVGTIISISGQTIVIKSQDGMEKSVVIGANTQISKFRNTVGAGDLRVNDNVVVIGQPNESGQIEARLIRIMPGSLLPSGNSAPVNPSIAPASPSGSPHNL
jgi:hypothetical protein